MSQYLGYGSEYESPPAESDGSSNSGLGYSQDYAQGGPEHPWPRVPTAESDGSSNFGSGYGQGPRYTGNHRPGEDFAATLRQLPVVELWEDNYIKHIRAVAALEESQNVNETYQQYLSEILTDAKKTIEPGDPDGQGRSVAIRIDKIKGYTVQAHNEMLELYSQVAGVKFPDLESIRSYKNTQEARMAAMIIDSDRMFDFYVLGKR